MMVSSASATAVVVMVVVTAGVRGAVVVGVAMARSSRVVPRWLGDDYDPGVDDSGDPAQDCEDDVDEEGGAAASAEEDC